MKFCKETEVRTNICSWQKLEMTKITPGKRGILASLHRKISFAKLWFKKTRLLCLYALKGMHTESRMTDYHDMDVIRVVELMITIFLSLVLFCNFM